jgi:hypothetical protein
VAYRADRIWEIRATTKETRECKDPTLEDRQPAKEACDSTGCGVAEKVTLAEQESRFCCSRSHRMTLNVNKQKNNSKKRSFHQSHVSQPTTRRESSIGAYNNNLHQFIRLSIIVMESDEDFFLCEILCGKKTEKKNLIL